MKAFCLLFSLPLLLFSVPSSPCLSAFPVHISAEDSVVGIISLFEDGHSATEETAASYTRVKRADWDKNAMRPTDSDETVSEGRVEEILGELEEALPEGYEGLADPEILAEKMSFTELWAEIVSAIGGARGYLGESLLTMLGLSLLLALSERSGGELSGSSLATGQAIAGTVLFGLLSPVVSTVAEALTSARELMGALTPVMGTVTLAGGGGLTAGVHSAGSAAVLWAIGYLGEPLLLGFVYSMLLLGVVGNMSGGGARLASSLRTLFGRAIGIAAAAFSGVVALQSVIASAQDNAAMRAVKYATGTLVPVVGSGVAGALGTLAGGLSYASGIVGGAGIAALLLVSVAPLAILLLLKLSLFIVISFLEFCHAPRSAALFSSFDGALSALASVYTLTTIVCIIQVLLFMKGGVTVFE